MPKERAAPRSSCRRGYCSCAFARDVMLGDIEHRHRPAQRPAVTAVTMIAVCRSANVKGLAERPYDVARDKGTLPLRSSRSRAGRASAHHDQASAAKKQRRGFSPHEQRTGRWTCPGHARPALTQTSLPRLTSGLRQQAHYSPLDLSPE